MRWLVAALAGIAWSGGITSALAFGAWATLCVFSATGSAFLSGMAGVAVGGALLGLLVEWYLS